MGLRPEPHHQRDPDEFSTVDQTPAAVARQAGPSCRAGPGTRAGDGFHFADGAACFFWCYLTAGANRHITRDQYGRWYKAGHHALVSCNDCHVPYDPMGRLTTAEFGP